MCCTCWMTFLLWFHHLMMFKKWGRNSWGYFWTLGVPLSEKKYRKGIPWDKIRLMEHGNKFTAEEIRSHLIYCEFFQKTQIMYEERNAQFAKTSQFRLQGCPARSIFYFSPNSFINHFDSMCRDDLAMCSDFLKSWNVVSFLSNIMWKKLRNPYILRGFLSK